MIMNMELTRLSSSFMVIGNEAITILLLVHTIHPQLLVGSQFAHNTQWPLTLCTASECFLLPTDPDTALNRGALLKENAYMAVHVTKRLGKAIRPSHSWGSKGLMNNPANVIYPLFHSIAHFDRLPCRTTTDHIL